MKSNKLMKFLASPEKIARALEWNKSNSSVLSIDIGHNLMGVAVAPHPVFGETAEKLEPIHMKYDAVGNKSNSHRILAMEVIDELHNIVMANGVCGFIVSWPVQKDGGHCGAPCGRVLHALDSLVLDSNILSPGRPFCLWDLEHSKPDEDEFGRCPSYGQPTDKTLHSASVEQYHHESSSITAAEIWEDFCRHHWPELYQDQCDNNDYMDADNYLSVAAYSSSCRRSGDGYQRMVAMSEAKRFSTTSMPDGEQLPGFAIL